jgi:hypothetical protein
MPGCGENLAYEFNLVMVIIKYGDSHGGRGEVLIKEEIVNFANQVSTFLISK